METVHEDYRKKRDSAEVVEGGVVLKEEKSKKFRANRQPSQEETAAAASPPKSSANIQELTKKRSERTPSLASKNSTAAKEDSQTKETKQSPSSSRQPLDLEVALQQIVHMNDDDESSKEFLSQTQWVKFRLGHAGDAAALADCYRKSTERSPASDDNKSTRSSEKKTTSSATGSSSSSSEDITSLEERLADGLGDEDTPPSIFALLADVYSDKKEGKLGAVALMSIEWEDMSRILRVEWFYVDTDDKESVDITNLLERRMWLRLSALAMMTSCQMLYAKGVRKSITDKKQDDCPADGATTLAS